MAYEVNEPGGQFLGEPATGRVVEDWEPIVYAAYAFSTVVLFFGLTYAPRTSIKAWARSANVWHKHWSSRRVPHKNSHLFSYTERRPTLDLAGKK
jgi:hypothetical protein